MIAINEKIFVAEEISFLESLPFLIQKMGFVLPERAELIPFSESEQLQHLFAKIGVFKSIGEAKRNGREGEIPPGISLHKIGKRLPFLVISDIEIEIRIGE